MFLSAKCTLANGYSRFRLFGRLRFEYFYAWLFFLLLLVLRWLCRDFCRRFRTRTFIQFFRWKDMLVWQYGHVCLFWLRRWCIPLRWMTNSVCLYFLALFCLFHDFLLFLKKKVLCLFFWRHNFHIRSTSISKRRHLFLLFEFLFRQHLLRLWRWRSHEAFFLFHSKKV